VLCVLARVHEDILHDIVVNAHHSAQVRSVHYLGEAGGLVPAEDRMRLAASESTWGQRFGATRIRRAGLRALGGR
jgi:hypothetical protein